MKTFLVILVIVFLCSCSPRNENNITEQQDTLLQQDQALADWKQNMSETDECSSPPVISWLANNMLKKDWQDCCWQHDFDYRFGAKYGITKDQADYELWECVDAAGHPVIANLIYDGVYIFGFKFYQDK